jgi:hypothetical protein
MKLNEFYEEFLTALGLLHDTDGFVSRKEGSKIVPLTIKDQRLVLPFDAQMDNPDFSHRIVFNPLYESLSRKESSVHEAIRLMLNLRLNTMFGIVAGQLLKIARDTDKHALLKPEQTEFLSFVLKGDKIMVENYAKLLDAFPGDRALVNIYSKPGGVVNVTQEDGTVKAEKFARAAIVSFPIYEALLAAKDNVVAAPGKNVKLRPKDVEAFKKVMEYVIPNIGKKDHYHVGSLSQMAPTMESLLKASIPLFNYFNDQLELFSDQIDGGRDLIANMDWANEIESNLGGLYAQARRLGMFEGNEGQVMNAPAAAAPVAVAATPVAAAPAAAPKKQVMLNPITGEEVLVPTTPVAPASPFVTPTPAPAVAQQWQQPQAFAGNSQPWGYQPPPAPAAGPVVKANGKVDFLAVMGNNPALAAQLGVNTQQSYHGTAMPQERTPSWAATQATSFTGAPRKAF